MRRLDYSPSIDELVEDHFKSQISQVQYYKVLTSFTFPASFTFAISRTAFFLHAPITGLKSFDFTASKRIVTTKKLFL